MPVRKRKKIQAVPRALILAALGWWSIASLEALDLAADVPLPSWSLTGPAAPVIQGQPFTVTAEVRLPPGYYQDTESAFLKLEPAGPVQVLSRNSGSPAVRDGKPSFIGAFTLTRTVFLSKETPSGRLILDWTAGWQICQIDGICLLPAEKRIVMPIIVSRLMAGTSVLPSGLDFWGALAGAFLGGLFLNVI